VKWRVVNARVLALVIVANLIEDDAMSTKAAARLATSIIQSMMFSSTQLQPLGMPHRPPPSLGARAARLQEFSWRERHCMIETVAMKMFVFVLEMMPQYVSKDRSNMVPRNWCEHVCNSH